MLCFDISLLRLGRVKRFAYFGFFVEENPHFSCSSRSNLKILVFSLSLGKIPLVTKKGPNSPLCSDRITYNALYGLQQQGKLAF